ncbi:hypothetical protein Tco_0332355 [Tanacetum coccineum]
MDNSLHKHSQLRIAISGEGEAGADLMVSPEGSEPPESHTVNFSRCVGIPSLKYPLPPTSVDACSAGMGVLKDGNLHSYVRGRWVCWNSTYGSSGKRQTSKVLKGDILEFKMFLTILFQIDKMCLDRPGGSALPSWASRGCIRSWVVGGE